MHFDARQPYFVLSFLLFLIASFTALAFAFRNKLTFCLVESQNQKNGYVVWTSAEELYTRFATQRRHDNVPGGMISKFVCPITKTPHYRYAFSKISPDFGVNGEDRGRSKHWKFPSFSPALSEFSLAQGSYESYARFEYWSQVPGSEANIDKNEGRFIGQWHSTLTFNSLLDELLEFDIYEGIRTTDITVVAFSLPCGYSGHWIRDGVHRVSYIAATKGTSFRFPVTVMNYEKGDRGISAHEDHWPPVEGIATNGVDDVAPWIFYDFLPHNAPFL